MIVTNALYAEIDRLRARVGELEEDLIINACMLAKQHDRNMELEVARDEWRRIAMEAKARVEDLLRDAGKMVKEIARGSLEEGLPHLHVIPIPESPPPSVRRIESFPRHAKPRV